MSPELKASLFKSEYPDVYAHVAGTTVYTDPITIAAAQAFGKTHPDAFEFIAGKPPVAMAAPKPVLTGWKPGEMESHLATEALRKASVTAHPAASVATTAPEPVIGIDNRNAYAKTAQAQVDALNRTQPKATAAELASVSHNVPASRREGVAIAQRQIDALKGKK